MGEEVRGVPEAAPLADGGRDSGIGRYLAGQRRLRGISLQELAALTKIPQRSLERLEAGAFDAAPDGFVRGFVRTVASALGLDPDQAVMRLMQEPDDEEAERRGQRLRQRTLFVRAAALAGVALGAALLLKLASLWLAPAPEPRDAELVLRRDPVRELAEGAPAQPPGAEPP